MSVEKADKVQQKEFPAFDYDAAHAKKTDVAVTIMRMDATELEKLETAMRENSPVVFDIKSEYKYTMTMTTGLVSQELRSLGNELIVCEYQVAAWQGELAAWRAEVNIKGDEADRANMISPGNYKELSEVAARVAFEEYAQKTYPEDKGIISKQGVASFDGKGHNCGYYFFVNKGSALEKNTRIGFPKTTLDATHKNMFNKQEITGTKIGDWIAFEKGNDAYLVKAELK